jgi:ketosteroid isomerase-like protein
MDAEAAARRWVEIWPRAWRERDADALVPLYADDAVYRALAHREPDRGAAGVRRYLESTFAAEEGIECWFGEPIVAGSRAAVEWWATWNEDGAPLTLAGTTVLRFDATGRVVDHRDYWNQVDQREEPYDEW